MCDVVCCSWRRCPRYLHVLTHSSPTRRSSDLFGGHGRGFGRDARPGPGHGGDAAGRKPVCRARFGDGRGRRVRLGRLARSEEHTSELQSLMRISYGGFCMKKTKVKKAVMLQVE